MNDTDKPSLPDQLRLAAGIEKDEIVVCRACGYCGDIDSYLPAFSMYNDCRCPKCRSTDNLHNDRYNAELQKAFRKESV